MINGKYVSQGQVAVSVPFDNSTGKGFVGSDVQTALEELRDHTIFDSRTQATTTSGTLTLISTDTTAQFITGSATGYSIQLPDATTLVVGQNYRIYNTGSQPITIKDGSGAIIGTLGQNTVFDITLLTNGSAAGTWFLWPSISNIISYTITSITTFTTSSATDVVVTGFTLTPQAGTYAIWYNASVLYTTTPKTHWWSIYRAGSQLTDTERSQDTGHSSQNMVDSTMTYATFTGSQTCDIRVRCDTTGSLSVNARSLLMIRLGT